MRPVGPREGGGRGARALRRVLRRPRPDADRRALAGDVSQPVFRGRAGADRGDLGASTSRSTTSRARRWACRSTSCSAASSATRIPTFATHLGAPGPEMIEQAQLLMRARLDCDAARRRSGHEDRGDLRAARAYRRRRRSGASRRARRSAATSCWASTTTTGCRVAEAASFCQKMPSRHARLPRGADPRRDAEAYEALRRMTDVPFAIGEEFASKWQFLPYIERGMHQFNRIDVCNVGGFTEAMKVAGWSRGALRRPDAAQPARPDLHRGDACTSPRRCRTSPGWRCAPRPAETHLGFDDARSSRCSRGWRRPLPGAGRAGPGRRGGRGAAGAAQRSSSGRRRICAGATARTPTGSAAAA